MQCMWGRNLVNIKEKGHFQAFDHSNYSKINLFTIKAKAKQGGKHLERDKPRKNKVRRKAEINLKLTRVPIDEVAKNGMEEDWEQEVRVSKLGVGFS